MIWLTGLGIAAAAFNIFIVLTIKSAHGRIIGAFGWLIAAILFGGNLLKMIP